MLPYIHIILPSYTVMAFLGSFFALMFLFFRIERYNFEFDEFLKMFVAGLIGCILGSKILYFLTLLPTQEDFSLEGLTILFFQSGYVFYGGLFGTLAALKIFSKYQKKDLRNIFKMVAPALPLFHGFGRIGCFLAGCCYGVELDPPIILFDAIELHILPTQIIESAFEFILFVILWRAEKFFPNIDKLKIYLLSYATFRFAIEFFRADTDRGFWLGVSTSQWISIFILAYYLIKWLKNKIKFNAKNFKAAEN